MLQKLWCDEMDQTNFKSPRILTKSSRVLLPETKRNRTSRGLRSYTLESTDEVMNISGLGTSRAMDHVIQIWLGVSTHLKNICQIGSSPRLGVKKCIIETTT